MGKWIPEWAKSYAIYKNADESGVTIYFSRALPHELGIESKPISQLDHDLAISDVCSQMRDKPLESRIKSLDDATCEEWDEGRMDNIGRNGNDGLAYTAKQMELKKTLLEAADKLMKSARLIA